LTKESQIDTEAVFILEQLPGKSIEVSRRPYGVEINVQIALPSLTSQSLYVQ